MNKHILLVQVTAIWNGKKHELWKQVMSGGYGKDSYSKCVDATLQFPDNVSWMIVAEARSHFGGETQIIEG